jgi:hypothetical protein
MMMMKKKKEKPKVDTPRDGKAWCDLVNRPGFIPERPKSQRLTLRRVSPEEYRSLAPVLNGGN